MSVIRIASRYAKSLVDLAQEQNKLDRIKEDMDFFLEANQNRDLQLLLASPIVNVGKKRNVFKALFEGKFDELSMGFFNIILSKSREAYLPDIAKEFMRQFKEIRHISTVTLTTAIPLDDAAKAKIQERLVQSDQTDDKVELLTKVDPDILGGFVLEFDNKLYNASVAHQLKELEREFANNAYVKSM